MAKTVKEVVTEARWWILFINPKTKAWETLGRRHLNERPADARPAGDDPFTPWYHTLEHLHVDRLGALVGAHVLAPTWKKAVERAEHLVDTYGDKGDQQCTHCLRLFVPTHLPTFCSNECARDHAAGTEFLPDVHRQY